MIKLFKKITLVFFTLSLFQHAIAQPLGKVIQEKTVKSTILSKNVNYTIYVPADYDQSQRTYPVVYLLHGYTDDNTAWLQYGEVNRYADKAIADGTIPRMLIVMPGGCSCFYINTYDRQDEE